MNEIYYKNRSVRACLSAAWHQWTTDWKHLVKKTLWAVVPCALLISTTIYLRIPNKTLHDWGVENEMSAFLTQSVVYGATLVSCLLAGAALYRYAGDRSLKKCVLVYLLPMILGPVVVLVAPLAYVILHFLLDKTSKIRQTGSYFRTGVRHWGSLLTVMILVWLITAVVYAVLCLPVAILTVSQVSAQMGALQGDPLGLPSCFTPLLLAVLTVFHIVIVYVSYWGKLAFAYSYGSIERQEYEKYTLYRS